MAIIHIYDTTPDDRTILEATLSSSNEVRFTEDQLTVDNIDAEAEVISVFVASDVSGDIIDKFPNLRLISCRSTGFNNVDLEKAKSRNVAVVNVPSYGEHTVAEYAFGLLLGLTRQIIEANNAFQNGVADHDKLRGIDLNGKNLGLIGTGHIGRNVATIARGFGMTVTAYDAYPNNEWAQDAEVTYADLDQVLKSADVVTLHIPYSDAVHHLINSDKLALMKQSAFLVNTARGELVDTGALLEALDSGKIKGAALDVFEGEALVDVHNELRTLRQTGKQELLEQGLELDVLRKLTNVLVTNHNAFNTVEALERINQTSADNIIKFLAGDTQNNVIK